MVTLQLVNLTAYNVCCLLYIHIHFNLLFNKLLHRWNYTWKCKVWPFPFICCLFSTHISSYL